MSTHDSGREAGFTLIEMLIVTTLIGVVAGIAVPTLRNGRLAANEGVVIATLRAISTAQFQFQSAGLLDQNGDYGFEYATLGELGAFDNLRGSTEPLSRNLLSAQVATVDAAGRATHHGYHFCLYLPDGSGVGLAGVPANAGTIDPVHSRRYWTCLAWPTEAGSTGNRSFFVNQQGQVLKTLEAAYSGTSLVPPAGAGLVGVAADRIDTQLLAADTVGADGRHWVAVH